MQVSEVSLHNFRNYEQVQFSLHSGVNVLIGENAQGKTNALEAIYLLAMGKSHRTHRDADLIKNGCQEATVKAVVQRQGRDLTMRLDLAKSSKRAYINGVLSTKMTDFVGNFQVVLFAPEDMQLVQGGPSVRRRFLDMEIGQVQPKYLFHLSQYQRVLQQRNSLLKSDVVDWSYISIFDEQLAEHGAEIVCRRKHFIRRMEDLASQTYGVISNHRELLSLRYEPALPVIDGVDEIIKDEDLFPPQVREMMLSSLTAKRPTDQHLRYTSVGPHRDDILFFLDKQPVQVYASQGQRRTIALSLRLAEIDFIHEETRDYPVLLLDDVLSELDDVRQRNLVLSMSEKVQTVLTTTSLFQTTDRLQSRSRLFHVYSGIIQEEG